MRYLLIKLRPRHLLLLLLLLLLLHPVLYLEHPHQQQPTALQHHSSMYAKGLTRGSGTVRVDGNAMQSQQQVT